MASTTYLFLLGATAATGVVWRVWVITAWRHNSKEYLRLCRDVGEREPTRDVLADAKEALRPPPMVSVIVRRPNPPPPEPTTHPPPRNRDSPRA